MWILRVQQKLKRTVGCKGWKLYTRMFLDTLVKSSVFSSDNVIFVSLGKARRVSHKTGVNTSLISWMYMCHRTFFLLDSLNKRYQWLGLPNLCLIRLFPELFKLWSFLRQHYFVAKKKESNLKNAKKVCTSNTHLANFKPFSSLNEQVLQDYIVINVFWRW